MRENPGVLDFKWGKVDGGRVESSITLRDLFAGLAMGGLIAQGDISDESAAVCAYAYADAMLVERGRVRG